nr:CoA transferase [Oceanococcus sp. HetDA_MAG_MS8]
MTDKPLSGLRILDLTRLLPGPYCTWQLAEMGAEVIKIEDPVLGDYTRSLNPAMFELLNHNKVQGTKLDFKQEADRQRFLTEMVPQADVVVEGFRPGVLDKLGVGYHAIREHNAAIVYCAITGYGQDGPYADHAGHDLNYCGYSGLLEQTGHSDREPTPISFQIADLAGGAQSATIGILAAVLSARQSGQGRLVDISMTDCTAALQVVQFASMAARKDDPPRGQDMLTGGLPNYRVYRCGDGKFLALGALEHKFWQRFCAAVGRDDLARAPLAPGAPAQKIADEVSELLQTKTRDQWMEILGPADCCASPVLTPSESLHDPHLRARGVLGGEVAKPQIHLPIRFG